MDGKISNEEVLRRMGTYREIVRQFKPRKLQYLLYIHTRPSGSNDTTLFSRKVHAFAIAHRQCLLTLSHNLAWHIVKQSLHVSQPDQLTRGPHSQLGERRLNTNKPQSYATTTRQTMRGPRQTMCRSHSPPTSPTATLHRKAQRRIQSGMSRRGTTTYSEAHNH